MASFSNRLRQIILLIALLALGFLLIKELYVFLPGFLGALLAQFIVVIFFTITILVSRISRNLDPISTMGLALFSYTTKLLFVGVFLWLLTTYTDRESINRTSFGVTAILLTLSWLGGEIASYTKLRIHLPLPGASSSNSGNQQGNESEGEK